MLNQDAINDLVTSGRGEIIDFFHDLIALSGRPKVGLLWKRIGLSLRNGLLNVPQQHVREVLVEVNFDVLGKLQEHDDRILPVLAVATGRITQILECLDAAERVKAVADAADIETHEILNELCELLMAIEKPSVRMILDERDRLSVTPIDTLRDVKLRRVNA